MLQKSCYEQALTRAQHCAMFMLIPQIMYENVDMTDEGMFEMEDKLAGLKQSMQKALPSLCRTQCPSLKVTLCLSSPLRVILADRDLTEYLMKILTDQGHSFANNVERKFVRDVKVKLCSIAFDYHTELMSCCVAHRAHL